MLPVRAGGVEELCAAERDRFSASDPLYPSVRMRSQLEAGSWELEAGSWELEAGS
jgi:hypothetical protein